MYYYMQQQLLIPWLMVIIWLDNFLSADPQQQQPRADMIIHHPLEDFNKHLLFLRFVNNIGQFSGFHHVHPLVLPHHPLLAAGPQTLPHHPGLPLLPPFQIPSAMQPALVENVSTFVPSQTDLPTEAQEQMNLNKTVVASREEPVSTTSVPVAHSHPQAIRPSLPSEEQFMSNGVEPSSRRKSQVKQVHDPMLQDVEVTLETKSNEPTSTPTTTTTITASLPSTSTAAFTSNKTTSYGSDTPTPKTLKGKIVKAAPIETLPIKQPTSVFIKEEHASLIRQHFDTMDLENFLQFANLPANDTQKFLKLVEKVLEEEVSKRLEKHSTITLPETSTSTTSAASTDAKPISTDSTTEPSIASTTAQVVDQVRQQPQEDEEIEDKLMTHEVKTVNTRLSYASEDLENGGSSPTELEPSSSSSSSSSASSSTTTLPLTTHNMENGRTSTRLGIMAGDSYSTPYPQESVDYRTQEQDEFDQLLDKLSVESAQGRRTAGSIDELRTDDSDLLADALTKSRLTRPRVEAVPQRAAHYKSVKVAHTETSEAPFSMSTSSQQLTNGRHNKFSVRHQPQTQFEHLVEDYRYRLSGHNGINDLIKALRNAHIGLFETNGPKGAGQKANFLRTNKRQWRDVYHVHSY